MKKILVGTHNPGKFKEIARLISKKYKKISPLSLKIRSPKETGKSFASNSKLKVKYFSDLVNFPVISDDSGLCIKCLNNRPGIYSARFAKRHGGFAKAMQYILKRIKKKENRKAVFVCSLSFKEPKKKIVTVEGRISGKISLKILGKKGFGYDPIFVPNNFKKTFGEMPNWKKLKMDHRFLAFKKLKKKIKIL
tara:strand:- start:4784 stop:5362 length:579 start_codon:yes stop_codon:yes gene_type:complete